MLKLMLCNNNTNAYRGLFKLTSTTILKSHTALKHSPCCFVFNIINSINIISSHVYWESCSSWVHRSTHAKLLSRILIELQKRHLRAGIVDSKFPLFPKGRLLILMPTFISYKEFYTEEWEKEVFVRYEMVVPKSICQVYFEPSSFAPVWD